VPDYPAASLLACLNIAASVLVGLNICWQRTCMSHMHPEQLYKKIQKKKKVKKAKTCNIYSHQMLT
jgi:hypothetical protein